jgi:methylthioribulose-1-phosphate dehydratase
VIRDNPEIHGIYLRRHGLYTWGETVSEAKRHIEIFEFLFEVLGRQLKF